MITAKCYGGPDDGKWIMSEGSLFVAPVWPPAGVIRTVTYTAMWIRPAGWRVAFPVFVQYRSSTGEAVARLEATYAGGERCSLPRRHLTPEELADRYWPIKRNGAI